MDGKAKINRSNYMTTGEFAQIMGVTKNTLFHYDSIGLFSPEIVLDNEYRYYSIYQMEYFDTILMLKELGMSLTQIKEFLAHRSCEQLLSAFEKREKQINLQIKKLREQKNWISRHKTRILEMQKQDTDKIYRKHYAKRYYLYMPIEEKTDAEFFRKTNEMVTAFCQNNPQDGYDIGYLQKESDIKNEIYGNYHNIILVTSKRPAKMKSYILEEGDYLVGYHIGHWDTIGDCYRRLLVHAAEQKLTLDHVYVEYYVKDIMTASRAEDYITEVSVRIIPAHKE